MSMMMEAPTPKNAVIGAVSQCDVNDVKIWMNSFIANCNKETDMLLLVIINDNNLRSEIDTYIHDNHLHDVVTVETFNSDVDGNRLQDSQFNVSTGKTVNGNRYLIHHYRFFAFWLMLRYHYKFIENVIITDVRDVVFDSNPFDIVPNSGVNGAGENILMKDEEWNKSTMIRMYGKAAYNTVRDNEVLCCGVMSGKRVDMLNICKMIYHMSVGYQVADQMALNLLYEDMEEWIEPTDKVYQVHTNWKYDESQLIRPNLHQVIPEGYPIIHQYDRIPQLKELFSNKYSELK